MNIEDTDLVQIKFVGHQTSLAISMKKNEQDEWIFVGIIPYVKGESFDQMMNRATLFVKDWGNQ